MLTRNVRLHVGVSVFSSSSANAGKKTDNVRKTVSITESILKTLFRTVIGGVSLQNLLLNTVYHIFCVLAILKLLKFIIFYIKVSSIHFLFGQKNGENAAGRGKITKNSKITLEKGFLLCYNVDTLRKGALSCCPFQGGSWLKRRQKEVVQASSKALKQALSIPAREAIL